MSLCDPKPAKNQEFTRTTECGNVIVIIFIMIALLGALYYTFSSGFRSGESQLSKEKADLAATEILDYAQSVKQAVQTLQINGCNETEINFVNNISSHIYTNANSPTDNSCNVFHPSGGGINYIKPNEQMLNNNYSTTLLNGGHYGDHRFHGGYTIDGISSTEPDLILLTNFISKEVCMKINDKISVSNIVGDAPNDTVSNPSVGFFDGTYGTPLANPLGDDTDGYLTGKSTFCRKDSGNLVYQFMQVLIAR